MKYIIPALITILGFFAVQRYVAYRVASARFRDIVLRELCDFYPTFTRWDGGKFGDELASKFAVLQSAVADFESSLVWYKHRAFRRAWFSYCNATGRECDINTYLHYFDSYDPHASTQAEATAKVQALFRANVQRLLSYAKEI